MQETLTEFTCDNCKQVVHRESLPVGWSAMTVQTGEGFLFEQIDLCDNCTQATIAILGKRRRIEGGRYADPALVIHNPPSPENNGNLSRIHRAVKGNVESVEDGS